MAKPKHDPPTPPQAPPTEPSRELPDEPDDFDPVDEDDMDDEPGEPEPPRREHAREPELERRPPGELRDVRGQVLVYIERGGPYRKPYNRPAAEGSVAAERHGKGAVEPVTIQLAPGLSLIDAKHWPYVSKESRFVERVKNGQVVVVAGVKRDLAEDWRRRPAAKLLPMLDRTGDVTTLELLRQIEAESPRPRKDVADAIDDRLRAREAARRKLQQERKTQRQLHRRRAW